MISFKKYEMGRAPMVGPPLPPAQRIAVLPSPQSKGTASPPQPNHHLFLSLTPVVVVTSLRIKVSKLIAMTLHWSMLPKICVTTKTL